ncbi:MAG: threo-3-hydroxy-L-aspartate ammonia-lyase [Planctomycetes bacterium]|nr:threo-3-hydroxy-L-aspartate ammonia-lyase [Planctomycetota bacterium]
MSVTLDDVHSAALALRGVANRTPVVTSRSADSVTGASLFFKCENLQRVGAFKFRGAYNALSRLGAEQRKAGVLTWSSGNHAQAVALAGRLLGIPRTIVMPDDAPAVKLAATRSYGAEVVLYDKHQQTREELGRGIAAQRGLTIIPPYDHPHIVAGQGTAALELVQETAGLDAVLAPVGGGGLLSGTAVATKGLLPGARVIGVEPALADDPARSFRTGQLQTVHTPETIADGARTPSLGRLPFEIIRRLVDDIVTVSDEAIVRAMLFCWERLKLVVEPTGALPLAALLEGAVKLPGKRVGVILSGGNADFRALKAWL